MSWAVVAIGAGAAISAGATAYSANQSNKAAAKNAAATGKLNTTPILLGDPAQVDPLKVLQDLYGANMGGLNQAREQATDVNRFNYNQAQKYYNKIAPGFSQRQGDIGSSIDQMVRGQLPADTVAATQRAAAQQGIQAGYGYGTQGIQQGAGGNLTARNLGLQSIDLTKYGIQAGMQFQSQAKALLPNMTGLQDFLLNPGQVLGISQNNATAQNQFALQNNQLQNQQIADQNKLAYQQSQNSYLQQLQQAQMIGQLGQSVGGAISGLGTGMGSTPQAAPATGGWGAATGTPYAAPAGYKPNYNQLGPQPGTYYA